MLSDLNVSLTIDQYTLIKHINDYENLSQIQLAKLAGKDPASIKRILDIIEKEGYILRSKSETSQRIHSLSLTDKGKDVVHKMFPVNIDFEAKGVEGISMEDMSTFNEVLIKIKQNFQL